MQTAAHTAVEGGIHPAITVAAHQQPAPPQGPPPLHPPPSAPVAAAGAAAAPPEAQGTVPVPRLDQAAHEARAFRPFTAHQRKLRGGAQLGYSKAGEASGKAKRLRQLAMNAVAGAPAAAPAPATLPAEPSSGPHLPTWEDVHAVLPAYRFARNLRNSPLDVLKWYFATWTRVDETGARVFKRAACVSPFHKGNNALTATGSILRQMPMCGDCANLDPQNKLVTRQYALQAGVPCKTLAQLPSLLVSPVSMYGSPNAQLTAVFLATDVAPLVVLAPLPSTPPPTIAGDEEVGSEGGASTKLTWTDPSLAADMPASQLVSFEDPRAWRNVGLLGGGRDAAREMEKPTLVELRIGKLVVNGILNGSHSQRRRFRNIEAWNLVHEEEPKRHRLATHAKRCRCCEEELGRTAFREWEWRHHKGDLPVCARCEASTYMCSVCEQTFPTESFAADDRAALHRNDGSVVPVCTSCAAAESFACASCTQQRPRALFERDAWRRRNQRPPVCFHCRLSTECAACHTVRGSEEFSAADWKRRATPRGAVCVECRTSCVCAKCQRRRGRECFSASAWEKRLGRRTTCLDCQFPG